MKKFLQVFLTVFLISSLNNLKAQCTVTNLVIDPVSQTQIGANVEMVLNIQFTTTTNGGNKQVFFHVWRDEQYPAAKMHPNPFNCTGSQSVGPRPSSGSGDNANYIDILDQTFINFGFNVNALSLYPAFSTTGINTSYLDWDPSGLVTLNFAGATISKEPTGNPDEDIIRILNLKFTVPNYTIGNFLQVRAFNWATNGTGGKPQCWGCGQPFVIGDPVISGAIACAQPGGNIQPRYTLFIDSKFDDPLTVPVETIQGSYELYLDADNSGTITPSDVLAQTSTLFTTSISGVPFGFKSRFAAFSQTFNNYTFSSGDPNSNKLVLAKVSVTTAGYLGAGSVGEIPNNCATLPVSLKKFNVIQRSGKAELTWDTEQESNNQGFEVQKRGANGSYIKVGFVASKATNGNGGANNYIFNDEQVLQKGVTYYRLKQVDLDGRSSFSEVKALRAGNGQIIISVYPNPSRGMVNVAIPESNSLMDVSVDDYTGKSVQRWAGIRVQNLQINNLKTGVYMLRFNFRESGETITQRIVVQ